MSSYNYYTDRGKYLAPGLSRSHAFYKIYYNRVTRLVIFSFVRITIIVVII